MESMAADELHKAILCSVDEAYVTRKCFASECDFKYELFHRLASMPVAGVPLADQVPGTPTCRLHGEAKPVNGNPSKADLLVCDPLKRMEFNYRPDAVIELKKVLTAAALRIEVAKFREYNPAPRCLYVISANPLDAPLARLMELVRDEPDVQVLARENVPALEAPVAQSSPVLGNDEFAGIVEECIRQTLLLYGRGRGQYHGFLWCNYEHEQGKGWTFPVEGDFNCHLYHRLRGSLPPSVEIVAEYHPPGLEEHLDLFLSCDSPKATAAIEVKMNWDQFKPKYHKGVLRRTEADTILHKFGHCAADGHTNYLVVIQGMDAHKSDHREKALSVLSASPVALHLLSYDERNEKSEKHTLARSAGIRGQPIKTGTIESAGDIVVPSTCAGSPRVDGIDGVTCSGLGSGESLTEPGQQARAEVLTMPESKTGRAAMPQGTDFSDMIARVEQAHLSRFVTDLRNHLPCDCVVSRSKDMWVVKLSGKIVFELHPRADHLLCAIRKPRVCDKKDIAPCGELQSDRSQTESHPYISFKIKTMEHLENAKALLVRLVDRER